jgi:hypothetical protein
MTAALRRCAVALVAAALTRCTSTVVDVTLTVPSDAPVGAADAPVGERFAWSERPAACYRSVGRVERSDGQRCAAVLVADDRAVTSGACVSDRSGARHLASTELTFRMHGGVEAVPVARVVHLRDEADPAAAADVAVLLLAHRVSDGAARPALVREGGALPPSLTLAAYEADGETLRASAACAVHRAAGDIEHDCEPAAAGSDGFLVECAGGVAALYGLVGRGASRAVSVEALPSLPLAPRVVAVAALRDAEARVYALDDATGRVHYRSLREGAPGAWRALPDARRYGVATAGSMVAFNDVVGPPVFAQHASGAHIGYRWGYANGDDTYVNLQLSYAVPGVGEVTSLAANGGVAERSQVYALGEAGQVYSQFKTTDGAGSPWGAWCPLGVVPRATALAAITYASVGERPARDLFVATPGGVVHRGSSAFECDQWDAGGFVPLGADPARAPVVAVAAATGRDGRAYLFSVRAGGEVYLTTRPVDRSPWAPDAPLAPALPGGVLSLAASRTTSGASVVVAVAAGAGGISRGEIFALQEAVAGGFAAARWHRLYR